MNVRSLSVLCALLIGAAPVAAAQTTTGSVRGYVVDQLGTPAPNATVTIANLQSGVQRTTTTDTRGFYALLGLVPGEYTLTVRRIGMAPQTQNVRVEIGEVLSADVHMTENPIPLNPLTVTATAVANGIETRTSEVATNVTPQQIQQLPTTSRNFLDFAALAPGVTLTPDLISAGIGGPPQRTFSADGAGPGEVNVFVDGASMKNDLTGGEGGAGGVAGQDASRGNPFPMNAIQEYRIITQNFKAEYQRSSSAIITAVTKSGGPTWSGDAFVSYLNRDLVALDSIQDSVRAHSAAGAYSRPRFNRTLLGLSAGGPLADKLRFFGSYEGNDQNRASTVQIRPPAAALTAYPALDSVPFSSFNGDFGAPFRETLLFGKLTYLASDRSSFDLSLNVRNEHDVRDFGGTRSLQAATQYRDNTALGILKHTWTSGSSLNEATVSYERFQRNPTANVLNLPQRQYEFGAEIGSYESYQNFVQDRLGFRDDFTYTGFHGGGDHVLKAGVNLDLLTYSIDKRNVSVPQFFYDSVVTRGVDTLRFNYRVPDRMVWSDGPQPFVNTHNTQLGVYVQDDWSPTRPLTLNLGVRWDFESHMFNTDYVTPSDLRDTVLKYNSQLQHPLDPGTYFTDGSQRKPFLGAIQPRLGFSYSLDRDDRTVLFGAWGIFYDRSYFDMSVDETLKQTYPTYTVFFADPDSAPKAGETAWNNSYLTTNGSTLHNLVTGTQGSGKEAWLIANNAKPPKSYQFNFGVRHVFGTVLVSVAYAGVRGVDGLVLNWANFNLNPNGSCCAGGSPFHGFSNIIYSTNSVKTWYDALEVQITRPYRRTGNFGWGAGLGYTYASRHLQGIDNLDDEFAFPNSAAIARHPANDEKHHVVANWTIDVPWAWGIQFGGLITLGSGPRYDIGGRFALPNGEYVQGGYTPPRSNFILPHFWAYRDVDIRLSKEFPGGRGNAIGVTLDVFNLFNYTNDGGYNIGTDKTSTTLGVAYGTGVPNGVLLTDPRRVQLGLNYHF